jgi:hypothetical protein
MIYLGLSTKKYVDVAGPDRFWSFLRRTGKDRSHNNFCDNRNIEAKCLDEEQRNDFFFLEKTNH